MVEQKHVAKKNICGLIRWSPGTPAMGILYAQEGQWAAALPRAERLAELDGDSVARNLLDRIRSAFSRE